jgi:hypothetical protein
VRFLEHRGPAPLQHLLVEQDIAVRARDHVHDDVVLAGLGQPVLVFDPSLEPRGLERCQRPPGVLGANEQIDVSRPTGGGQHGRSDLAHHEEGHVGGQERVLRIVQRREERLLLRVVVPIGMLLRGAHGDLLRRSPLGRRLALPAGTSAHAFV